MREDGRVGEVWRWERCGGVCGDVREVERGEAVVITYLRLLLRLELSS